MNRDDYIAAMDRALSSTHGCRLEFGDDEIAQQAQETLPH
jgi:hypothetical protein